MGSKKAVLSVKLHPVPGSTEQRLPEQGIAEGIGNGFDVVEFGVGAAIHLVHFEVEPVDRIARQLGALIPDQGYFAVARHGGEEGRSGRPGEVVVRVVDILHGPLVAEHILEVVAAEERQREPLRQPPVDLRKAGAVDVNHVRRFGRDDELALVDRLNVLVPEQGVVVEVPIEIGRGTDDHVGQPDLVDLVIIGELKVGLAGVRPAVGLRSVGIRAGVVLVFRTQPIRPHVVVDGFNIQVAVAVEVFARIEHEVVIEVFIIVDPVAVHVYPAPPVAVVVDQVFPALIHHAVGVVVHAVVADPGAFQEAHAAVSDLKAIDDQISFQPLVGDVVFGIEQGLVIPRRAGDIVIHDHRDDGRRDIIPADVFHVERGDKDIFSQYTGPLVLPGFHLDTQAAASSVGPVSPVRFAGGRIEERVVGKFIVVAVVGEVVRFLIAPHKGSEGPIPASGAYAGPRATGRSGLEGTGRAVVPDVGLGRPEGRPGLWKIRLGGVLYIVDQLQV